MGRKHNDGEIVSVNKQLVPPVFVVGLGTSAGGWKPWSSFLMTLHINTALTFIVVQDLPLDYYQEMMLDLLSKHTHMTVQPMGHRLHLAHNLKRTPSINHGLLAEWHRPIH